MTTGWIITNTATAIQAEMPTASQGLRARLPIARQTVYATPTPAVHAARPSAASRAHSVGGAQVETGVHRADVADVSERQQDGRGDRGRNRGRDTAGDGGRKAADHARPPPPGPGQPGGGAEHEGDHGQQVLRLAVVGRPRDLGGGCERGPRGEVRHPG